MKRIALKQEWVPEFLNGATTLRIPVSPQPTPVHDGAFLSWPRTPYPVGSELALTETWGYGYRRKVVFKHGPHLLRGIDDKWRPAITMPAEFSRFKRRVVAVIVEHGELWDWVLELEEVK